MTRLLRANYRAFYWLDRMRRGFRLYADYRPLFTLTVIYGDAMFPRPDYSFTREIRQENLTLNAQGPGVLSSFRFLVQRHESPRISWLYSQ